MDRDELLIKAMGQGFRERLDELFEERGPKLRAGTTNHVVVDATPLADAIRELREDFASLAAAFREIGGTLREVVKALKDRPPIEVKPVFRPEIKVSNPTPIVTVNPAVTVERPPDQRPKSMRLETDKDGVKRAIPEY